MLTGGSLPPLGVKKTGNTLGDYDGAEEWNMAKAYYIRVDHYLWKCAIAQENNKPIMWRKSLLILYKNIRCKMNAEQRATADTLRSQMDQYFRPTNTGGIPANALLDFELCLMDFLEKKGMLTPKGDDPSTAYRQ